MVSAASVPTCPTLSFEGAGSSMPRSSSGLRARRRSRTVKIVGAGAVAAAALGTITVVQPHADATPVPAHLNSVEAQHLAQRLELRLGEDAAGAYYKPKTRELVVNVTDGGDAETVREAGAVPRSVAHSVKDLRRTASTLGRTRIPGTAWAIEPRTNKVLVTVDASVKGRKWTALKGILKSVKGTTKVQRIEGTFRPFVSGGDAIVSGGARCSAGFNATKGNKAFLITAGHCSRTGARWSEGTSSQRKLIGTTVESRFPGDDFAVIRYDNPAASHPSAVDLYNGKQQPIRKAVDAFVGMKVTRSGSTTGVHGGSVLALNATVTYPQGRVQGLVQTNVCAEPGDSGGALFSGSSAVGLTSGGNGNCRRGGVTFFQPVTEVLSREGLKIGAGGAQASEKPDPRPKPSKAAKPRPKPSPATPAGKVAETQKQVLKLVNQERRAAGCRPLVPNRSLSRAAQAYTSVMARAGVLSHTGPDGSTISTRAKKVGYEFSSLGENIARGQRSPQQVMSAWMNSSGHRRNILNCTFRDIGIGFVADRNGPWWTQDFGTRR
ncbi:CAP domain-containing protein [Streptomyces sp. NPDC005496]|uniref:CAP domain-containing protein n=1 Tax=Streptomyces sp. NPDC005496 TaxID=3364716 RepID=UPI00367877BE